MGRQMCQSCGQPLKENIRGTEADGSASSLYCELCYKDGKFVNPDITLKQMQEICIKAMRDMRFPKFMAKRIADKQLPKLIRWQKTA
jgi:hypothetical protein